MVYSSSRTGTRSLIKTAVLCALSLSVIPSAFADGSLDASSSADVCGLSDGDKSVGIRVIDDTSCASGGLGCYNDHCRFCKILETPQSSSFENCTTFGVEFPTMAPLVASAGTCEVSSGDAAVGISAITDPTCLYGGLGCFNDHCRFCKVESTAQSEAFVDCTGSNSTDGSTTETPVDTATSASSTAVDTDGCTLVPADGDVEVGISIGTDPSCSVGGLGCINDVCRFCRIRTTAKSATYTDCALLGTSAAGSGTVDVTDAPSETPAATTETPAATTVADTSVATDAATEAPPATTETPAATDAASPETPSATTETPAATDAATSDVPASTTAAPVADATCAIAASVGDAAVGINIVTDATCVSGGIGCINDACRFCKVTTSTQSAAFMDCALFAGAAPATEVPTADNSDEIDFSTDDSDFTDASDAAAETPVATTAVPAETPSATTAVPNATTEAPTATVATPVATTAVPDAITEAPAPDATSETPVSDATTEAPVPDATTAAVAPDATTEAPAGPTCTQTVSEGDAAVGINIITDTSCSAGGVGCIDDVCRFCKTTTTVQSAAFVDCASTTAAATDAPTETPTEAPATEAPTETPTEAPTTEAPTEAPIESPTGETCAQTVSEGDAAVGINIVTDTTCSAGGVGCIDSVCRFCKVTSTDQSAAFVDCSSITGVAAEAQAENIEAFSSKQTRGEAPQPDSVPLFSPVQAVGAAAGCIVAVAAVALIARAAKKANNSTANPNEPSDDDNVEDAESGRHVSPGPVPTEDDEEVTTISTEA